MAKGGVFTYPDEIRARAKELVESDEKLSADKVVERLNQEFGKSPTRFTINNWINKYGWDYKAAKQKGVYAFPVEVRNRAKELLNSDERLSVTQVAKILNDEFDKAPSSHAVRDWIRKYGWKTAKSRRRSNSQRSGSTGRIITLRVKLSPAGYERALSDGIDALMRKGLVESAKVEKAS